MGPAAHTDIQPPAFRPADIQAEYWRGVDPAHLPALAAALLHSGLPGLLDAVPAYQSLYIEFDRRLLGRAQLTTAPGEGVEWEFTVPR